MLPPTKKLNHTYWALHYMRFLFPNKLSPTSGEDPLAGVHQIENWPRKPKSFRPAGTLSSENVSTSGVLCCWEGFCRSEDGKVHNVKEAKEPTWLFSPSPQHIWTPAGSINTNRTKLGNLLLVISGKNSSLTKWIGQQRFRGIFVEMRQWMEENRVKLLCRGKQHHHIRWSWHYNSKASSRNGS